MPRQQSSQLWRPVNWDNLILSFVDVKLEMIQSGGTMDEAYLRRQLAINRDRVASLARGISEEQARWKPDEESWSILEVVCHLADEEEFDFPARLRIILEDRKSLAGN